MTEHEALIETRDVLRRYGWVQGRFGTRETGFCLMGAISVTTSKAGGLRDEWLIRRLQNLYPRPILLTEWNDLEGRTEEEVFALLDAAIRETAPPGAVIPPPPERTDEPRWEVCAYCDQPRSPEEFEDGLRCRLCAEDPDHPFAEPASLTEVREELVRA